MEQVFILVATYVDVDSGNFMTDVIAVYDNYEMAQEQMKREIESTRKDFENYDYEEENFVDGDMSWSIWEKDEYPSHHCDLQIFNQIVIEQE